MTEHIITYDFDNNSFSNLPNDSSGEKKFIFTADDVIRDEGGTAVTIVAKYKKIKAKRPIIISWKSSKPIAIHIDISREDYDELTDINENLIYFAYGDNEKTIEDYRDYKGENLRNIFDRVKIVEDKVEEILAADC